MALVLAAAVLLFGISNHAEYVRPGEITFAIWGLILLALISGIAGRVRRIPAFLYLSGAHLLGAYYLTLHKHGIEALEF